MQSNDDDSRRADACVLTHWKHRQRADEQSDLATLDDMQPLSVIKHIVWNFGLYVLLFPETDTYL